MSSVSGRTIIYGGRGALGAQCVSYFKSFNWWVGSIDFTKNEEADLNVIINSNDNLDVQESQVLNDVGGALNEEKLDSIICLAGGWSGGNAQKYLAQTTDQMWKKSMWSSLIATSLAVHYLKEGGLLALNGAKVALEHTPTMIGYGITKGAVHNLTRSLAFDNSGLPSNSVAIAILPSILDTPMNRELMPDADTSNWTPLSFVVDMLMKWSIGKDRPPNGSLVQLITKNSYTSIVPM